MSLDGASIGGHLNCAGGQFTNPKGTALSTDNAKIDGTVSLNDGFTATGLVSLDGATSGGHLNCGGGQFTGLEGHAFSLERAHINGAVALNNGFKPLVR